MKKYNVLALLTVVFNSLILFGMGHGVGPMDLVALFLIPFLFTEGSEYQSLAVIALTSIIGQIVLLFSMLLKKRKWSLKAQIVGILILWVSFYQLTYKVYTGEPFGQSHVSFISGIPFIIVSALLLYFILTGKVISSSEK